MTDKFYKEKVFPNFFPEQIKIQKRNNPLIGSMPTNQWTDFYNKKETPLLFKPLNRQIREVNNPPLKTQPPKYSPPKSPPPPPPSPGIQQDPFKEAIRNSRVGNIRENKLIASLFSNRKYIYYSR